MSDITQGADASDNDLFRDVTSTETLNEFENPTLPLDLPPVLKPGAETPPVAKPETVKAEAKEDDALVPAQRLRETNEAKRQAERERDEWRAKAEAAKRPPTPPPPQVDIFDNPSEFVQQQVKPLLDKIAADSEMQREVLSRNTAIHFHGREKVAAAYKALEQGLENRDPFAAYAFQQARNSYDPYGAIMEWHQQVETLKTVGTDPKAYRAKTEEELLSDPAFLRKATERARSQAMSSGNSIARPARQTLSSSPSLGDIGAGGGDGQVAEPSDEALFRAATAAKRR